MTAPAPAPGDALTVSRILKVNRAGEFGAIRIYGLSTWGSSTAMRRDMAPAA